MQCIYGILEPWEPILGIPKGYRAEIDARVLFGAPDSQLLSLFGSFVYADAIEGLFDGC